MNRILLTIGGNHYLLPSNVDAGPMLAALLAAEEVTSHGYGEEQRFTRSDSQAALQVQSVPASKYVSDTTEALRIELKEAKESANAANRNHWDLYRKNQELEKKLKELQPAQAAA